MSSRLRQKRELYVEGPDDEHSIGHLLLKHGIAKDKIPEMSRTNGIDAMWKAIVPAISFSVEGRVGFMIDANSCVESRWHEVCEWLRKVEVNAPDDIPSEGFVGISTRYKTRVGVWLMPDNCRPGALEDFLCDLIPENDPLLPHARESTQVAKELGASFRDVHYRKAVLRAWLAWQKEPGLPYGTAIGAGFIGSEGDVAGRFVGWFRRLFLDVRATS